MLRFEVLNLHHDGLQAGKWDRHYSNRKSMIRKRPDALRERFASIQRRIVDHGTVHCGHYKTWECRVISFKKLNFL